MKPDTIIRSVINKPILIKEQPAKCSSHQLMSAVFRHFDVVHQGLRCHLDLDDARLHDRHLVLSLGGLAVHSKGAVEAVAAATGAAFDCTQPRSAGLAVQRLSGILCDLIE